VCCLSLPSEGKHYFCVRLLAGTHYYIGVAEKGAQLDDWFGGDKHSWAYYRKDTMEKSAISANKDFLHHKFRKHIRYEPQGHRRAGPEVRFPSDSGANFGDILGIGDVVTVCVNTSKGTISFARNNEVPRVCFTRLERKELHLAIGLGPNGTSLKVVKAWSDWPGVGVYHAFTS
jgi:hypothetical protein